LSFGDSGIEVKDYTFNKETGKWQPALTPEQQAGVDAATADVLEIGADPSLLTIAHVEGRGVVCTEKSTGAEVCVDGKFEIHFAQEALANSGILKPTKYKPDPRGSFKNSPTDNMRNGFGVPLLNNFRREIKVVSGNDPMDANGKQSTFNMILCAPDTLSWCLVARADDKDPKSDNYFIYDTIESGVGWVLIQPVSPDEALNYWTGT